MRSTVLGTADSEPPPAALTVADEIRALAVEFSEKWAELRSAMQP